MVKGEKKSANETAQEEGLNEERSAGNAGAFEGFENTGEQAYCGEMA